jgi:hypothetical protein
MDLRNWRIEGRLSIYSLRLVSSTKPTAKGLVSWNPVVVPALLMGTVKAFRKQHFHIEERDYSMFVALEAMNLGSAGIAIRAAVIDRGLERLRGRSKEVRFPIDVARATDWSPSAGL